MLSFRSFFSFIFSPPNLRGRLADCHQTVPHGRWWPRFIKFGQKFGWPLPPKFGGPKTSNFVRFRTTSRLRSRIFPGRNKTSSIRKSIANYGHSHTGKLNLVHFGPQTAKNRTGVLAHALAIVHRTGVNKSVAFDRWWHWPTQWAAITLGTATLSSSVVDDCCLIVNVRCVQVMLNQSQTQSVMMLWLQSWLLSFCPQRTSCHLP